MLIDQVSENTIVGQSVPHKIRQVASSSACFSLRGPAVVDAEMPLPNNADDDDLESDADFVRNCGRMAAFERE